MRRRTLYLTALLATIFLVLLVAATLATRGTKASPGTRYVSNDGLCGGNIPCYTNVQDALDASDPFDEILVATGTYTDTAYTVAEITETITLQGGWNTDFTERDPDLYPTTLDAQRNGRVVYIEGAISPTIDGFIITGGDATYDPPSLGSGGGIYSRNASPIIVNNIITDNIASIRSEPYVGYGGGLSLDYAPASALISGNQILSNTASIDGRGYGGGLSLFFSNATVSANTVSGNTASDATDGLGGGIVVYYSQATLDGNLILSNKTCRLGGGVYVCASDPFTLTNNFIAQNRADVLGGGIFVYGLSDHPANGTLINNTIAQNNLGNGSHGVYVHSISTLSLINNIVVSHTYGIYALGAPVTADYTLFFGNTISNTGGSPIPTSTHEVYGDPLFVDSSAWDYHIQRGSPAIDAGTTIPWVTTDIDGEPRPICAAYDIGADEYPWCHIYLPLILKNY